MTNKKMTGTLLFKVSASALAGIIIAGVLMLPSCKKKESTTEPSYDKTYFAMRMTDAPGNYDAVYIDIVGAEVHSDFNGWSALNVRPGIYNLLDLTNGKDTLIADGQIAVGNVSQIRLILGDNNSVVVDGQSYPLSTPSAQQSGLKLQVKADLQVGIAYTMLIDFDADKSIVRQGNGNYSLKPVIRVVTTAINGAVRGIVLPLTAKPLIYAINGTDSFSTYASTITGGFYIGGLAAGTYKIVIMPKAPYMDSTIKNVGVTLGVASDLGIVALK